MQKTKKLKVSLTKSLRKMNISGGTSQSQSKAIRVSSSQKLNPNDYISHLLNSDLLAKIAHDIPARYLQNFMQVNKYINESLREYLPVFIKQHFLPKQIRSRAALEAAKNDALLNQNTLHTMSLEDFLLRVRPGLIEWVYLRQHYIEKFEELIRATQDNDAKKLLNLKRIALIYIDFTKEDIERFIQIQTFNYRDILVIYPEYIDISRMLFDEFMATIHPFIIEKFNQNDKNLYIHNLESLIADTHTRWQAQPRDQEEWDQYDNEMNNVIKYGDIITSIRHPEFSIDEIIEHREHKFQCHHCYPPHPRFTDYN